jgi:hypothetical protein
MTITSTHSIAKSESPFGASYSILIDPKKDQLWGRLISSMFRTATDQQVQECHFLAMRYVQSRFIDTTSVDGEATL